MLPFSVVITLCSVSKLNQRLMFFFALCSLFSSVGSLKDMNRTLQLCVIGQITDKLKTSSRQKMTFVLICCSVSISLLSSSSVFTPVLALFWSPAALVKYWLSCCLWKTPQG